MIDTVPSRGVMGDYSGAIVAGATAQALVPANQQRRFLLIQNISDTAMWVNFGIDAVADKPSIQIAAAASLTFNGSFVPSDSVSIICTTIAKKFVCKEA